MATKSKNKSVSEFMESLTIKTGNVYTYIYLYIALNKGFI
jgi:hypothetical protein